MDTELDMWTLMSTLPYTALSAQNNEKQSLIKQNHALLIGVDFYTDDGVILNWCIVSTH